MNPNIRLKTVNKSQGKRTKEEETEKNYKNNPKTINKMAIKYIAINNYFKCKWTKCSNQNTQSG